MYCMAAFLQWPRFALAWSSTTPDCSLLRFHRASRYLESSDECTARTLSAKPASSDFHPIPEAQLVSRRFNFLQQFRIAAPTKLFFSRLAIGCRIDIVAPFASTLFLLHREGMSGGKLILPQAGVLNADAVNASGLDALPAEAVAVPVAGRFSLPSTLTADVPVWVTIDFSMSVAVLKSAIVPTLPVAPEVVTATDVAWTAEAAVPTDELDAPVPGLTTPLAGGAARTNADTGWPPSVSASAAFNA
jgi:hypothetical protein